LEVGLSELTHRPAKPWSDFALLYEAAKAAQHCHALSHDRQRGSPVKQGKKRKPSLT
jgi:hypothetical protein